MWGFGYLAMGQVQTVEYARGMISLMFGIGTIVIALVLTLMAALQSDLNELRFKSGKEVLTSLIGIFGTILGFYFGSLADGKPNNPSIAGLQTLGAVIGPNSVNLSGTRASDNDLLLLRSMPQLERLYLDNTPITDKGVLFLHELKNLKYLSLKGTGVGEKSIEDLKTEFKGRLTVIPPDTSKLSQPPPTVTPTTPAKPASQQSRPTTSEETPPAPPAPGASGR